MKDLSKRIVPSLLSILIVTCLLLFAFNVWFQYVVASVVAALSWAAFWEYEQLAKAKGAERLNPSLPYFAFLLTLSFFIATIPPVAPILPVVIFFILLLNLFALHFREKNGAIVDLAVSAFGLLYIAVPMGMILGILYSNPSHEDRGWWWAFYPDTAHGDGRWWVAYLLVVTKITDIGAYFAGNLWGKHKLAPHISPSKTIEGAIFGLICAVLASFCFYLISSLHLGALESIGLGIVLGIVGQFGDLSESLLKRDANKKDSNGLPGFGGALDAVDSLLFNIPIIYFYINFVKS